MILKGLQAGGGMALNNPPPPQGSVLFDGTSSSYLITSAQSSATYFGTGDFTIEAWVRVTSTPEQNASISSVNDDWQLSWFTDGFVFMPDTSSTRKVNTSGAGAISTNTWYHIAFTRQSSSLKSFLNGTLANTGTDSANYNSIFGIRIGANRGNNVGFPGYISNLRIIKGTALYTATFTAPTKPLTAVLNTQLLLNTVYDPNFLKDNSVNDFEITNNGNVTRSPLNPF